MTEQQWLDIFSNLMDRVTNVLKRSKYGSPKIKHRREGNKMVTVIFFDRWIPDGMLEKFTDIIKSTKFPKGTKQSGYTHFVSPTLEHKRRKR